MISIKTHYDAIVVGAGPAGSTTGALLAEKGRDVLIVEKENFPLSCGRISDAILLLSTRAARTD